MGFYQCLQNCYIFEVIFELYCSVMAYVLGWFIHFVWYIKKLIYIIEDIELTETTIENYKNIKK